MSNGAGFAGSLSAGTCTVKGRAATMADCAAVGAGTVVVVVDAAVAGFAAAGFDEPPHAPSSSPSPSVPMASRRAAPMARAADGEI